jgi:hypothetical protein
MQKKNRGKLKKKVILEKKEKKERRGKLKKKCKKYKIKKVKKKKCTVDYCCNLLKN